MKNLFNGKTYGVIGFGNSGRASATFLKDNGAKVYVFDDSGNSGDFPKLTEENFAEIDVVLVSPGIHLYWSQVHPCIQKARKNFIPIVTDLDVFQRVSSGKNICITGTNGKSTTTALTYHVLKQSGKNATIGGNFGPAILSLEKDCDFNVLEISSYQLEGSNILGYDVSVLLNITSDHLTRHGGMTGYIASKQKIFANYHADSYAIISVDDSYCREVYQYLKSINHPHIIAISGNTVPNDGIGWKDDCLMDGCDVVCKNNPLMEGVHNRQNIAATYAICKSVGLDKEKFINGLMSFQNLEHRQQLVRTINGVQYVNDSKATNCDSVEQALKRYDDIIWILGGEPKEEGIEKLTKYFDKIKCALLIGLVAEKWSKFLSEYNVKNEVVHTLDIAVNRAHEIANSIGAKIVLLSPTCASFDQFKSFEDRGNKFIKYVQELS